MGYSATLCRKRGQACRIKASVKYTFLENSGIKLLVKMLMTFSSSLVES